MEDLIIKKRAYKVLEELNPLIYLVEKDNEKFIAYDFKDNYGPFDDFRFAAKRLRNSGLAIPDVYIIDKKNRRVLMEYIDGPTPYDILIKENLDEKIIEQVFLLNYKARINGMRLDFNPQNFRIVDDTLYYIPFTFTSYLREADFTEKEIRLWFYTKEFVADCISKGVPVDKSRLLGEYEQNKQIVLTVVKYFR